MFGLFNKKENIYKEIDAIEMSQLIGQKDYFILDVRAPEELNEGSVPGSQQMNFFDSDFQTNLESLDQEKTYLVYCKSGNRSSKTCQMMNKLGFKNLYNLKGGIKYWNNLNN